MAGGGGNPLGGITQAAGAVTGAFTALTGSINAVAGPLKQFVEAINPAIVAEFERSMRDLNAVFGIAVLPIMEALTGVVRDLIGSLVPVMTQLQPIIRKVAETFGLVLTRYIEAFAAILTNLLPVLDFFAEIIGGIGALMADWFQAMRPVIEVMFELGKQLVEFVANLLGVEGTTEGFFKNLQSAFQMLIKNVILAAATFMKMIGATDTLGALIKGLKPPEQGPKMGIATLQNAATTTDFASIGRKFAESAFIASAFGGKGGPKKTEDFLGDILKQVQDIKDGKGSPLTGMAEQILAVLTSVWDTGKSVVENVITVTRWVESIYRALPSTSEVDDAVGGFFSPEEEQRAKELAEKSKAITGKGMGENRVRGAGWDKRGG